MGTPSSSNSNGRGRMRQPNFVNDEVDCLLELIAENKDVILSTSYNAYNTRQKTLTWEEIANHVTDTCGKLWTRDGGTVRQKWKDLLVRGN